MQSLRPLRTQTVCWSCQIKKVSYRTALIHHRSFSSASRDLSKHNNIVRSKRRESHGIPTKPARTRFAPSPTGYLHLGSVRTALYNYLLAKKTDGEFILRVEDTDQKRTVPDAEQRIKDDLRWLGLHWDEGPDGHGASGPYRQSDRTEIYRTRTRQLLDTGKAYRCFCSAKDRQDIAEQRHGEGLVQGYDRTCAHIPREESNDKAANGEPHVIRLFANQTSEGFTDLVYGNMPAGKRAKQMAAGQYDDVILVKSDGIPTYHLANVVDDHLMEITHVIRGVEWLPSTPLHIELYKAFGWELPRFAHVGLLVDEKQQKLSKRNQETNLSYYREQGYLPEALINFLVLQGWHPHGSSEILTMAELKQKFHMKFTRGNVTVQLGKLNHLQRKHAGRLIALDGGASPDVLTQTARVAESAGYKIDSLCGSRSIHEYLNEVLRADHLNYTTPADFVERNKYMFVPFDQRRSLDAGAMRDIPAHSRFTLPVRCALQTLRDQDWNETKIAKTIHTLKPEPSSELMDEWNKMWIDVRAAVTYRSKGAKVANVMAIIGRDDTLKRLSILVDSQSSQYNVKPPIAADHVSERNVGEVA